MYEDIDRKSAGPLATLFTGNEAAKVIDFLLSKEKEKEKQHPTMVEIHEGTKISMNVLNKIIDNLLDIDAIGVGARRIKNMKSKDEDTYYIRDDSDTGKSIRDLWYHLMQVQTKSFTY
jgi:hypothetical protein